MVIRKPCKNTLYFSFSCSYLKNEQRVHPNNMQAAMEKTVKVTPDVVPTTAVAVQLFEGTVGGN